MKILCCIGYYDGDKEACEDLALLMSELLPNKSDIVSLGIVSRFDAKPFHNSIITECAKKFKRVLQWRCDRRGTGFPAGCNELAYGILNWPPNNREMFEETEAVVILEGDVVFTRMEWDKEMLADWEQTKAEGKLICGNVLEPGFEHTHHVNAVAMYDKRTAEILRDLRGGPNTLGWDFFHGKITAPVARNTPLNYMDYQKPTITARDLFAPKKDGMPPLIFHGVKDASARTAVRMKYDL